MIPGRRKTKKEKHPQTAAEEKANIITHGAGFLLAVVGLVFLLIYSAQMGEGLRIVSYALYGTSLVLLYLASTLYHSATDPKKKHYLKIFDHSAIYLLIAGSYTPFALVTLNGATGWLIFSLVWGLALAGIVFKLFFVKRFKIVSTLAYVAMGWICILVIEPIMNTLPTMGLVWLVAGGLAYTTGVVFYLWDRLPFNHTIWHLFVMAGSASHFIAIFLYV